MTILSISADEKLVIIPDIHNKCDVAERIIRNENPDKVVFLGDYFDSFYDTVEDADRTSKWLARSLRQKGRTHLIGNHDLSYMTCNPKLKCTGYDPAKHDAIRQNNIPWSKLSLFCWADDWLCTHAGLTRQFYMRHKKSDSVQSFLEMSGSDLENMNADCAHLFFQAGFRRGGTEPVGGILWCHYDEFEDIAGIRQVFGHTRNNFIRHKKTGSSEHLHRHTVKPLSGVQGTCHESKACKVRLFLHEWLICVGMCNFENRCVAVNCRF